MYMCPNHKALYSRSKDSKLLWIPLIDEAEKLFKQDPTEENLKSIVDNLSKSHMGSLETSVMTFEKVENDGSDGPSEHTYPVTWVEEHAKAFFDSLTQYLGELI